MTIRGTAGDIDCGPSSSRSGNSTLVVRLDDSVRVQFQFQNQRP